MIFGNKRKVRRIKAKDKPKTAIARTENLHTQPLAEHRVFNNPNVLSRGWYPVCSVKDIRNREARSFRIAKQRIVMYRTESGVLKAMDAFCPHMGTDLSNGRVIGENIQCYFHQWELGGDGCLKKIPCMDKLTDKLCEVKNTTYPVLEEYGHIWVYSHHEAAHAMIKPSCLEGERVSAIMVKECELFAHHHVMMANGVDMQHLGAVHDLNIDFDYNIEERDNGTFSWRLKGKIPTDTLRTKIAKKVLGEDFEYHIKFAGGSVITITYGVNAKVFGRLFPPLHVLWGCIPQDSGISKIRIFFVTKKRDGLIGKLQNFGLYLMTFVLLTTLRDEDVEAFPFIRFNTDQLIKGDASLARFIRLIDKCELSHWGDQYD